MIVYASISAISAIRIYAISGKNTKLAAGVLGLGMAYAVSSLVCVAAHIMRVPANDGAVHK